MSAGRAIIEDILFTFDPLEGQHYQLDTVIKVQPNLFFDTYATLENLDSGNKISVAQRKFTYSKPIRCLDLYDDIPEDNYVIKMESKKIKAR